jgi:transposase, IS6 family
MAELNRRCRPELRKTNRSWRIDETNVRVARKWTFICRAVDSTDATMGPLLIHADAHGPPSLPLFRSS